MSKVTWPPRSVSIFGAVDTYRYALDASGRRVAFVRELATMDGWRVSLFPDGNHNHSVEGRIPFPVWPREDEEGIIPEQEAFAIKMATRWLDRHV